MDRMVTAYVCGRKRVRDIMSHGARSQTMTEYALILAAIAIAAYLTYQVMGQDISSMVTGIDTGLSSP
jgi:Flp pilus assembly pilin Flp